MEEKRTSVNNWHPCWSCPAPLTRAWHHRLAPSFSRSEFCVCMHVKACKTQRGRGCPTSAHCSTHQCTYILLYLSPWKYLAYTLPRPRISTVQVLLPYHGEHADTYEDLTLKTAHGHTKQMGAATIKEKCDFPLWGRQDKNSVYSTPSDTLLM